MTEITLDLAVFFSGIATACFAAASVFFIKFWRASGDRFFLRFSFACTLLSAERVFALVIADTYASVRPSNSGAATWILLMRLLAFVVIVYAVILKNRESISE